VGAVVARELFARGAVIVGVSDVSGGIVASEGLDLEAVSAWTGEHRFVRGYPDAKEVDRLGVLEAPCDVLVPAALERQITADNAERLDCKLVVEAANGPTTPEADEILARRGIEVIPDVLANAGGVTVSYFEWVQDQQKYSWTGEEIVARLRLQLQESLARVVDARKRHGVDWRTAAQSVAIDRVAEATRLRTIYP
jgi:glutamate dehydrogenase/leucine dehydrogenase